MKGIEKILEALAEKIVSLETTIYFKDLEIENLKKGQVEQRPATKKAEETRAPF